MLCYVTLSHQCLDQRYIDARMVVKVHVTRFILIINVVSGEL